MNYLLIDALFSVSSYIREIRKDMDMLTGDRSDSNDFNPSVPTPLQALTPLFARTEERATSGIPRGDREKCGDLPLQDEVERPGARLMIKVSDQGRECYRVTGISIDTDLT